MLAGISVTPHGMPDLLWSFDHAGSQFEIMSPLQNLDGCVCVVGGIVAFLKAALRAFYLNVLPVFLTLIQLWKYSVFGIGFLLVNFHFTVMYISK